MNIFTQNKRKITISIKLDKNYTTHVGNLFMLSRKTLDKNVEKDIYLNFFTDIATVKYKDTIAID